MWKYKEYEAYNIVSLHDCRSDSIYFDGNDLIFDFSDGFWILPETGYHDNDRPLKTGPAQIRMHGYDFDQVVEYVDMFKTTCFFRKQILSRRVRKDIMAVCNMINRGSHELEFLWEYHRPGNALYQCCFWRKGKGLEADCQFEATVQSIEYLWNEIIPDREW